MNDEAAPKLTRVISWEDWEKGRARRRAVCERLNDGRILRRQAGDPRKDAILRRFNNGERGAPFAKNLQLRFIHDPEAFRFSETIASPL